MWAGDGGGAGSKGLAEAPTRGLLAAALLFRTVGAAPRPVCVCSAAVTCAGSMSVRVARARYASVESTYDYPYRVHAIVRARRAGDARCGHASAPVRLQRPKAHVSVREGVTRAAASYDYESSLVSAAPCARRATPAAGQARASSRGAREVRWD